MTKTGPHNLITDVAGFRVGNAQNDDIKTGATVFTAEAPFTAGVHVMGGAPGTRETELLAPDKSVQQVHALTLSGGSAFGLDAASGVADALRAQGIGLPFMGQVVPIVPSAILFDLLNGGEKDWEENPYKALGAAALADAKVGRFDLGSIGAGVGATSAGLKGGLGSASAVLPSGITVGALVAVNPLGSATVGDSKHFWAAPFEVANEFGGHGVAQKYPDPHFAPTKMRPRANTTIGIVATDAALTQAQCTRLATAAHDGMARALVPSHTPQDGDLIFGASSSAAPKPLSGDSAELLLLGHVAATCMARAIARAIYSATPAPNDLFPTWREVHAKSGS